jgi:hypothetical protein
MPDYGDFYRAERIAMFGINSDKNTISELQAGEHCLSKRAARPLSIASRVWIASDLIKPPVWTAITIEGHGNINHLKFNNALQIASAANPGSRLVLKGTLAWSHWVDSGKAPVLTEIEGSSWDGMTSQGVKPFLKTYDVRQGPTAEVLMFCGEPTRIIFRAHHAVMDGRGLITWIEDVFRVLNGRKPLGSDHTTVENDLLHLPDKTIHEPPAYNFISPVGKPSGNDTELVWKRISVPGQHTKLLASVLLLLAQASWRQGKGPVRFGIPVDLRHRRPGLRSTGNLTNAIYIEVKPGFTVEQIAAEIQRRLREKDDGKLNLEDILLPYIPISILSWILSTDEQSKFKKNSYRCTGFVTNLGRVDLKRFSCSGFSAASFFVLPIAISSLPLFLTMSGYNDRTDYVLGMPKNFSSEGRMEEVLDYIVNGLKDMTLS